MRPNLDAFTTAVPDYHDRQILVKAISQLKSRYELHVKNTNNDMLKLGLRIFVEPNVKVQPEFQSTNLFTMTDNFLSSKIARSLIILGSSGMGKTLLAHKLTQRLWDAKASENSEEPSLIPLYISLNSNRDIIETKDFLSTFFIRNNIDPSVIALLLDHCRFVLILDGYDEVNVSTNWFSYCGWESFPIKIIITSRPEGIYSGNSLNKRTTLLQIPECPDTLQLCQLEAFNQDMIIDYMQHYSVSKSMSRSAYQDVLASIDCESSALMNNHRLRKLDGKKEIDAPFDSDSSSSQDSEIDLSLRAAASGWEYFYEIINNLSTIMELVRTPVLLYMVMRALPRIVEDNPEIIESKSPFAVYQVYEAFTSDWFESQAARIHDRVNIMLPDLSLSITRYMRIYSENLAASALSNLKDSSSSIAIDFSEEETLNPNLLVPQFPDQEPGYDRNDFNKYFNFTIYEHKKEELQRKLSYQKTSEDIDLVARYEKLINEKKANISLIRSGALLSSENDRYCILHKSIIEYLTSDELYYCIQNIDLIFDAWPSIDTINMTEQDGTPLVLSDEGEHAPIRRERINLFFTINLRDQKKITELLAERVVLDDQFKSTLFTLIEYSKEYSHYGVAAANAATILVRSKVNLSSLDWRHVNIPGANLSHGIFWGTDFSFADLSDCWLNSACLLHTKFNGTNLSGFKCGLEPSIDIGSECLSSTYSADGRWFAVGDVKGTVHLFDAHYYTSVKTLKNYRWFEAVFTHQPLFDIEFSKDITSDTASKYLAATHKNEIWVWDWQNNTCDMLSQHSDLVLTLSWSPVELLLASGGLDRDVLLWKRDELVGWQVNGILTGHQAQVNCVQWSPSGSLLASASEDQTVFIWTDNQQGNWFLKQALSAHTASVECLAWSFKGDLLATGSSDMSIVLWRSDQCEHWFKVGCIDDHHSSVRCLSWSPTHYELATSMNDETIRLWKSDDDGRSWYELSVLRGHANHITRLMWAPNGQTLISSSRDNTIAFWDYSTISSQLSFPRHFESIDGGFIHWSPDEDVLAVGPAEQSTFFWGLTPNLEWYSLESVEQHTDAITAFAWAHDSGLYAAAKKNHSIIIGILSQDEPLAIIHDLPSFQRHLSWSFNASFLASAGDPPTIMLHKKNDDDSWALLKELSDQNQDINSISWSPTLPILACAYTNGSVVLWSLLTENDWIVSHRLELAEQCVNRLIWAWSGVGGFMLMSSKENIISWNPITKAHHFINFSCKITDMDLDPESHLLATVHQNEKMISIFTLNHQVTIDQKNEFILENSPISICFRKNYEFTVLDITGNLTHWHIEKQLAGFNLKLLTSQRYISMTMNASRALFEGAYFSDNLEREDQLKKYERLISQIGGSGKPSIAKFWTCPESPGLFKTAAKIRARSIVDNSFTLSTDASAVSILSNDKNHAYLLIEFLSTRGLVVYRSEISISNSNFANLSHKRYEDNHLYTGLRNRVRECGSETFSITTEQLNLLMDNIHADQHREIPYSFEGLLGHNCLTWCFEKLHSIGIDSCSKEWIKYIIKSPSLHLPSRKKEDQVSQDDLSASF